MHAHGTTLGLQLLAWHLGGAIGAFGSGWASDRAGANRTLSVTIRVLVFTLAVPAVTPLADLRVPRHGAQRSGQLGGGDRTTTG